MFGIILFDFISEIIPCKTNLIRKYSIPLKKEFKRFNKTIGIEYEHVKISS